MLIDIAFVLKINFLFQKEDNKVMKCYLSRKMAIIFSERILYETFFNYIIINCNKLVFH
ncbi:hypothetical protein M23134_03036 [Microscilla marina ATCC 23134]|uniref:Uncharacterized protein n=1 Tax=Microscilla marina ATCC 23134 TaxID=313606 RepID=A2A045_MICM2|nr:hypothetical protein M23134_03036 [Microscilla marina ATCC 23134]